MTMTTWPPGERPRERLLERGPSALSDAELLAIFIRTGCAGLSAVDIARNALNEFVAWQLTALLRELDRGLDLTEQACESAQLHAVTRSLHCATAGVSQNHNQFGACQFASKLHRPDDVVVQNIPGDANAEDIAQPLIEDQLGRRTRVDATQDDGKGILPVGGNVHLL